MEGAKCVQIGTKTVSLIVRTPWPHTPHPIPYFIKERGWLPQDYLESGDALLWHEIL